MRKELIDDMIEIALKGQSISSDKALQLESFTHEELDYLFIGTDRIRDKFKGEDVKFVQLLMLSLDVALKTVPFALNRARLKLMPQKLS